MGKWRFYIAFKIGDISPPSWLNMLAGNSPKLWQPCHHLEEGVPPPARGLLLKVSVIEIYLWLRFFSKTDFIFSYNCTNFGNMEISAIIMIIQWAFRVSLWHFYLVFFSYFLKRSWRASMRRSVRVLSCSTARNLSLFIMGWSNRNVTCFFSIKH